jgi:Tfp pilus assembly protein PilF
MRTACLLLVMMLQLMFARAQHQNLDSLNNLLKNAEHDSSRSILLSYISRHFFYTNIDTALQLAHRGMILAQNAGFVRGEAVCKARLGQAYGILGNDPKSLGYLIQALKIADSAKYQEALSICYSGLGAVYSSQEDVSMALYYDLKSLEIADIPSKKLTSYLNIGDDYEKLNKLDSAKYFTNLAFDAATELNEREGQSIAYNNLGNVFLKMNQHEVAMANYKLALSSLDAGQHYQTVCETTLGLAKIFMKQGREDSALYYAKRSFEAAQLNDYAPGILKSGTFLADYYRRNKVVDSAYAYLTHVIALKDSMYSQERTNQIRNMAFEEKMRQQELELRNAVQLRERKMNIQFAIIAVTVVSFLIVFFLLSQSIIVNEKWVRFLGILALLLVFEFINLLIHPWLADITQHSPALMLLGMVAIAALIIPMHHRMEHWVSSKLVSKNKRLRLAAARKIVAQLEPDEKSLG